MLSDLQIRVAQTLIVSLVGITFIQAYVIRRLENDLRVGEHQFNKLHNAADYLLEIINKNDIELTEFDLIAITEITNDMPGGVR